MIILGIDPGTRIAGFGIIRADGAQFKLLDYGNLELSEKKPLGERLLNLNVALNKIFSEFKPHMTVIEKVFVAKNPQSALHLGHARGICLMQAVQHGSEVIEYATREVKKGITGKGSSDKWGVRNCLQVLLGQTLSEELDATDALALAVHHANQRWVESRLREGQL